MGTITSADVAFTITIQALFPVPQQLQGFATDDIYGVAQIKSVETMMGVDGVLSGGFVFVPVPQEITLQADSESNDVFDLWWTTMQATKGVLRATGLIQLPAIATKFVHTSGFLTGYTPIPAGKRVLQPRRYEVTWQSIVPVPG